MVQNGPKWSFLNSRVWKPSGFLQKGPRYLLHFQNRYFTSNSWVSKRVFLLRWRLVMGYARRGTREKTSRYEHKKKKTRAWEQTRRDDRVWDVLPVHPLRVWPGRVHTYLSSFKLSRSGSSFQNADKMAKMEQNKQNKMEYLESERAKHQYYGCYLHGNHEDSWNNTK